MTTQPTPDEELRAKIAGMLPIEYEFYPGKYGEMVKPRLNPSPKIVQSFVDLIAAHTASAVRGVEQAAYQRGAKANAEAQKSTVGNAYKRGHANGAHLALTRLRSDVTAVDLKGYDANEVHTIWLGNINRLMSALNNTGDNH